MPNLDTKADALQWRKYYPTWLGLNDGLDEAERWYVLVRREPSRSQVLDVARRVVGGADLDLQVAGMEKFIRGPFNLLVDGDVVDTLSDLIAAADSAELVDEIHAQIDAETEITEEQAKNSDALSGGDSMQPEGATAETASETQAEEDAPESTTQGEESGS